MQRSHSRENCNRCSHLENEATKKTIDQGHINSSRTKVYFKPSVVEIQDETVSAKKSLSPSKNNNRTSQSDPKLTTQSYLLGP